MDFVAALDAQQMHRVGVDASADYMLNNTEQALEMSASPKGMRKFDPKKRWKNWGWKYNSTGKATYNSSIEEEPAELSSTKTSRHSSPNSSPKHKKTTDIASSIVASFGSSTCLQSPLRRRNPANQHTSLAYNGNAKSVNGNAVDPTASNNNRHEIRSSAGARLCQAFESGQDDDGNYEFQSLLINERPASIHIVPMSSTQQIQ